MSSIEDTATENEPVWPTEWASGFLKNTDYDHLNTLYKDEIQAAKYIFNYRLTRHSTKDYLRSLKIQIKCNAEKSNKLRKKANALYKNSENLEEAAILYTKAIYMAPIDSLSLAEAHATRAAVLYKLQAFEASYEDCTCAVNFNHPNIGNVLVRQAAAAWKLQDYKKLQDCIARFQEKNLNVPSSILRQLGKLEEVSQTIENPDSDANLKLKEFKKIKISHSEGRGRCVIALEPIEVGEVILEEKAAAFLPYENILEAFWKTNETDLVFQCDNCAERDIVPFPCYECRAAFYCSSKCRQEHLTLHQFECRGNQIFLFNRIPQEYFALRYLLVEFDHLLDNLKHIGSGTVTKSAVELWPMVLKTCKDGELLGQFSDFRSQQSSISTLYKGMLASLVCSYLSEYTDFFKQTNRKRHELMPSELEWQILVTALLIRFSGQILYTSKFISEYLPCKAFTESFFLVNGLHRSLSISKPLLAVYPYVELLNHSCYSNTYLEQNKLRARVICRSPIAPGDEICHDYIWDSGCQSRKNRQEILKTIYNFKCNCSRCKDGEDPVYKTSLGMDCQCGNFVLLSTDDMQCSKCHAVPYAGLYLTELSLSSTLDSSPETFIYLYGAYGLMKNLLNNKGKRVLTAEGEDILTKYLSIEKSDDLNLITYEKEFLNNYMITIVVGLMKTAQSEYMPIQYRAMYAALLFDLLALRKGMHFPEPLAEYRPLLKDTITAIRGKTRKLLEDCFKLYCK